MKKDYLGLECKPELEYRATKDHERNHPNRCEFLSKQGHGNQQYFLSADNLLLDQISRKNPHLKSSSPQVEMPVKE